MTFHCNLCGAENELNPAGYPRDDASCTNCWSSVRLRALVRALTLEICGCAVALPDLPVMKGVRGLGISDNRECAEQLAQKFDYRNTSYCREPHFDITLPPAETGLYDFVIASDVFEHVAQSVGQAFANVRALLKPHGVFAMTVPWVPSEANTEHFPDLHEYGFVTVAGRPVMVNRTRAGEWQVFDNPVFHGGEGATLELRVFSEAQLRRELNEAGFSRVECAADNCAEFGIVHQETWALPIIAGNEPFRHSPMEMAGVVEQHADLQQRFRAVEAARLRVQAEFEDRTRWALSLKADLEAAQEQIAALNREVSSVRGVMAAWMRSRWMGLGRALGVGPKGK